MSPGEWDTHWARIFDDARIDGASQTDAIAAADRETTEQFGERPKEQG